MKRTFVIRSQEIADALARFVAANWREMESAGTPMAANLGAYRGSRTNDQLAAMWAGIVQPLADQAWIGGRQYSADVWHEFLKRETIPAMLAEQDQAMWQYVEAGSVGKEPPLWIKAGANLWSYMPDGSREFCGSTGQLTKLGMSEYMQRIEAYAVSEHGVKLPTRPGEI